MFWKKKNSDQTLIKVLEMMKVITVELARHGKDIELIQIKLRQKAYKNFKGVDDVERNESIKYNDGFDELRELNKKSGSQDY